MIGGIAVGCLHALRFGDDRAIEHHEGAEGMPAGHARLLRIGDGASQIHPIGLGRLTLGHERSGRSFLPVHSVSPLFGGPLGLVRPPYTGHKLRFSLARPRARYRCTSVSPCVCNNSSSLWRIRSPGWSEVMWHSTPWRISMHTSYSVASRMARSSSTIARSQAMSSAVAQSASVSLR